MAVSASVRTSILGMRQLPLQRLARYSVELAAGEEPELRRFLLLAPQEVDDYPDVQRVEREALGPCVEQAAHFALGRSQVAPGGSFGHAGEGAVGQCLKTALTVRQQRLEDRALHFASTRHEQLAGLDVHLAAAQLERGEEVGGVYLTLEVTHEFARRTCVLQPLKGRGVVRLVERQLDGEQVLVVLVLPRGLEEGRGQFAAAESQHLRGAGHVGGGRSLLQQRGLEGARREERALDVLYPLVGVLATGDGLQVGQVERQQQDLDELVRLTVREREEPAGRVVEVTRHGLIHYRQPLAARLRLLQLAHVGRLRQRGEEGAVIGGIERGLVEVGTQQPGAHAPDTGVDVAVISGHLYSARLGAEQRRGDLRRQLTLQGFEPAQERALDDGAVAGTQPDPGLDVLGRSQGGGHAGFLEGLCGDLAVGRVDHHGLERLVARTFERALEQLREDRSVLGGVLSQFDNLLAGGGENLLDAGVLRLEA